MFEECFVDLATRLVLLVKPRFRYYGDGAGRQALMFVDVVSIRLVGGSVFVVLMKFTMGQFLVPVNC